MIGDLLFKKKKKKEEDIILLKYLQKQKYLSYVIYIIKKNKFRFKQNSLFSRNHEKRYYIHISFI